MSAESNMVRPASRQTSTRRVASRTSLSPQALKNSLPPPNVPVPRLSTGTLKPEPPSRLDSIAVSPVRRGRNSHASGGPGTRQPSHVAPGEVRHADHGHHDAERHRDGDQVAEHGRVVVALEDV